MTVHHAARLPYDVHEDENVWIPVSDGIRLAARMWRPVGTGPVPAIVEYIPYRKRDRTSARDSVHHPYLAGHGYACVRVDIRGTGESEGVLTDEYLEREQQDAVDVLAWLAAQPWCTGRTAMMGISWGGFAALQTAARRPPSLAAIAISNFTDDRYGDDFHYQGGCMLADNLAEAGTTFATATLPPDPALVGDRWRDMWRERLQANGPWVDEWLRHQRLDDYWRHASVNTDYAAVRCPVLATGGWADGYTDAVFRVLTHLDVPRLGIVGPWEHKYPHLGGPGPAIGYPQLLVRWFDRWLKDIDNGVEEDPALRVWIQHSAAPGDMYRPGTGHWIAERWPTPDDEPVTYHLAGGRLVPAGSRSGDADEVASIEPVPVSGHHAGKWASYGTPPDLPGDQRPDDERALCFDSDVLDRPRTVLGAPYVTLELTADRPVAMIAARLCDVAPDGTSTRVSYGLLNLTHRDGDTEPRPLEPGRSYRAVVHLRHAGYRFAAGHRIRLALSSGYWPLAWPSPDPARLGVRTATARLVLPVHRQSHEIPYRFDPPEGCAPREPARLTAPRHHWTVTTGPPGETVHDIVKDDGTVRYTDADLDVTRHVHETYRIHDHAPSTPTATTTWDVTYRRDGWHTRTRTELTLTADRTHFLLHAAITAYDHEDLFHRRTWTERFPRDGL